MIYVQRLTNFFALDQDLNISIFHDRVIDFFSLLRSYIANKLRDHLGRIKHVITKDGADEGHDEGVFGGFLRLNGYALQANFCG
ncbi:hypothetical protein D3C84_169040 [compost metagenome]